MNTEKQIIAAVHAAADIYPAGTGHFVYTSGMHGDGYVDYRPIGKEPKYQTLLHKASTMLLAKTIREAGFDTSRPITVIGPQTMGALMIDAIRAADCHGELGSLTVHTRQLIKNKLDETGFVWSADPTKILNLGQTVVMDDLLNQSKTFQQISELVIEAGGKVDALAVFGDRCNFTAQELGVQSITSFQQFPGFTVQSPLKCVRCTMQLPILRHPGHGHKFEVEHPDYPGGFVDHPA